MSTEVVKTEPKKELPPIEAGPAGLTLTSLDDYWRLASFIAKSGLAPKGVQSPEAILVAMQMGAEVGLPPMAALQNIAVINGRPSLWGDAMLGICRRSGLFDEKAFSETYDKGDGTEDGYKARCVVRRLPDGQPILGEFSVKDAKRAKLWGKASPWTEYPQRMLKLRARAFALRDGFADVLRGLHSAEELTEQSTVDSTPKKAISRLDMVGDKLTAAIEGPPAAPEPATTTEAPFELASNGHSPDAQEAPSTLPNGDATYEAFRQSLARTKSVKGRGDVLAEASADGRLSENQMQLLGVYAEELATAK